MQLKGSRGEAGAGFYAHNFSVSRHCDGGTYVFSIAGLPSTKEGSYSFTTPIFMQQAESAQTRLVRVLRPMLKATVHNKCGLPMCAMAELKPRIVA